MQITTNQPHNTVELKQEDCSTLDSAVTLSSASVRLASLRTGVAKARQHSSVLVGGVEVVDEGGAGGEGASGARQSRESKRGEERGKGTQDQPTALR